MNTEKRLGPGLPGGINRVQVGVGPHNVKPDWWNTDIRPFDGVDEAMDATLPWKWQNQLDFIFAEHFFEHIDINAGLHFLLNAGNALRPGGIIRLSTPSLEWVLKTHFHFAAPEDDRQIEETFAINRAFYGWGHRFLYSKAMLHWVLQAVGLIDISFHAYGESQVPALQGLEAHGGWGIEHGYPSVWIVEAKRGVPALSLQEDVAARIHKTFSSHVLSGH